MTIEDFDYILPEYLIAQNPAYPRDSARLLIVKGNVSGKPQNNHDNQYTDRYEIIHKRFYDLIDYLDKGDVLVMNQTSVLHAKLLGKKTSGAQAEIILIKNLGKNRWIARIKTRNPNPGQRIILRYGELYIIERKTIDTFIIRLSDRKVLKDALLPNPPYIKRIVDDEEYQTVFAKDMHSKNFKNTDPKGLDEPPDGSLAAPTAGLHFTKKLLKKISDKGVKIVFLTLHVGFGTFLMPTNTQENTEPEYYEITKKSEGTINKRKGRLIVVGTTTLKALETSSKNGIVYSGTGYSDIFIKPGYKFNLDIDVLITNFHLPKSSLIMLTSAFYGRENILKIYHEAIDKKYMFYSLGDAMMLIKEQDTKRQKKCEKGLKRQ